MTEKDTIRYRLQVNNLSWTWLIAMLNERGITCDNATMSRIMAGTRQGDKVDLILSQSIEILNAYDKAKEVLKNAT